MGSFPPRTPTKLLVQQFQEGAKVSDRKRSGMELQTGFRVVNEAEPRLGLGLVKEVDRRNVEVHFPAVGESRVYRLDNAPLRRHLLGVGQVAESRDGRSFTIDEVDRNNGVVFYRGEGLELCEIELCDAPPASGPLDDLRAVQMAPILDFQLRARAWHLRSQALGNPLRGLLGARVDLLPHQLYVAAKVISLPRSRVLLADEVGLGKTIEAGLIFGGLAATERAQTVLVVVPEPLVHQWLAEFYRRFNLLLEIYNPEVEHPQQRVLCSFEQLEELQERAWDLVVVDEAHHVAERASMERLAANCGCLLLLSATPSREGPESLFRLLRLVDPDRFSSLERFLELHQRLRAVSDVASALVQGDTSVFEQLQQMFPGDAQLARQIQAGDREGVLDSLVDRHGTGRVLIRNRRPRLEGLFPGRRLCEYALEDQSEARLRWLLEYLAQEPPKTLLITSRADEVMELYEAIKNEMALPMATFHEGMSLMERDRQAAYFAEPDGARLLLASEIGSEGRNFQFASDLILYDLPLHPDLLEQRIGRLDRIGQQNTVNIHLPFPGDANQYPLLRWHRQLDSFSGPVPGAELLVRSFGERLVEGDESFWREVAEAAAEHREQAARRVDVLVDRNSFHPEQGRHWAEVLRDNDADPSLLRDLPPILERFGVLHEELEPGHFRVRPGDMMFVDSMPGLPNEDGITGTYDRQRALIREDLEFLSLEHPLVEGALSLMLDQQESRAMAARWRGAPETLILAQFLFVTEATGPAWLELGRWLPLTCSVVSLDHQGHRRDDLERDLPESQFEKLPPEVIAELVRRLPSLEELFEEAQQRVAAELEPVQQKALAEAAKALGAEVERLRELARVNPMVGPEELEQLEEKCRQVVAALSEARPRLDAVRLILCQA